MKQYLIPEGGQFYKANMHMHSTVSDGENTPEEIKKMYKEQGYSILAYTDHELMVPHHDLEDESFLPILSYEFSINRWNKEFGGACSPCYHLNFYAKDPNEKYMPIFVEQRIKEASRKYITDEIRSCQSEDFHYSVEYVNFLAKKANEMGFLVSYNHPAWSLQDYRDYAGLEGIWGVEFCNYGCIVEGWEQDCNMRPVVDMLRAGKHVYPLATDDAHHPCHQCGGWISVKAPALTYKDVMHALEAGDFYASTGPEIKELYIDDEYVVHVTTSEATQITLNTERRFARVFNTEKGGETITHADFHLYQYIPDSRKMGENAPWEPFFRISVRDKDGNFAHSRAYFVSEIFEK